MSEAVSIAFLALAAGSILYVVIELLGVCRNLGHKTVVAWGITLGPDARLRHRLRARRRRRLSRPRGPDGPADYPGRVPLASVYPLVSSRAVARPFTYEVPDGVGKGAIVQVRLGRSTTRGVVVEVGVEPPAGIALSPAGKVLDAIPPALVDLALWVADYYGTTPARALEPSSRPSGARRVASGRRRRSASRCRPSRHRPSSRPSSDRAVARIIVAGIESRAARHLLLVGPTGSGKTEVYLQATATRHSARPRHDRARARDRARAPDGGRFRERFGDTVAILHSALGQAERRDERDRIASGEARIVVGARSAIFAPISRARPRVVDEEHDALVQAGVGSSLRRAHGRGEARGARGCRRGLRQRHAPAGELGRASSTSCSLPRIGAPMPRVRIVDLGARAATRSRRPS